MNVESVTQSNENSTMELCEYLYDAVAESVRLNVWTDEYKS